MSRLGGRRGLWLLGVFLLTAAIRSPPAVAESPTSADAMRHGLALLRAGDAAAAETVFRRLVEEDPHHGPARFQLGRLALERRELEKAELHLEVATASGIRRPFMAWHLLGRVQLLQGQAYEAASSFDRALDLAPEFAPARVGRARTAHLLATRAAEASGELWVALAGYRQLLEGSPKVPVFEARAARVARSMGALELAKCLAESALRTSPEDGALNHLLGAIQADLGAHEAAIASCRRAIDHGGRDAAVYQTLGRAHFERMETREAVAAYGKALELDPETARALPPFALASLNPQDLGALGALLAACLEIHPENANVLYGLALVRLRSNELDRAGELFEKLATLSPDDSRVPYNLASVYFRLGDRERGEAAMHRFQELKAIEDQNWLRRNRAHALRLEALDAGRAGNGEGAIRIYEEMAAAGIAGLEDYLEAGRLLLELGDGRRAYGWFEGVLETDPYQREALEGRAAAADALGRREVARQDRERLGLLASPCR